MYDFSEIKDHVNELKTELSDSYSAQGQDTGQKESEDSDSHSDSQGKV